jgi:undecaprenyl-phosphate 4-deoxy-4-formamido-L-arabinose transferase
MLPSLSIVVPVFNGASTIRALICDLDKVLPTLTEQYEAILVEDGSRDNSWEVICELIQAHAWIRGIRLMRNFGQHNALLCGIRAVRHDIIVTMDDDLQHPPAEIPHLLAKLAEGFDVVYGVPDTLQHGLARGWSTRIVKLLLRTAVGVDIANKVSAFRAFRTQVREGFAHYHSPFVSIDVLLTWATTRFAAIHVHHQPRLAGVSNYSFFKLIRHTLNLVTGFSTLPLRFASFVGFGFTATGFALLAYVIGRWFIEESVPGFPFLASVITTFSGVILLILGVIGEYLSQMHVQLMGRPTCVIRETVGFRAPQSLENRDGSAKS